MTNSVHTKTISCIVLNICGGRVCLRIEFDEREVYSSIYFEVKSQHRSVNVSSSKQQLQCVCPIDQINDDRASKFRTRVLYLYQTRPPIIASIVRNKQRKTSEIILVTRQAENMNQAVVRKHVGPVCTNNKSRGIWGSHTCKYGRLRFFTRPKSPSNDQQHAVFNYLRVVLRGRKKRTS